MLPLELQLKDPSGHLKPDFGLPCQRLGPTKPCVVVARRRRGTNELPIAVDLDEGDAQVGHPPQGFKSHEPLVAQDDESLDPGRGPGERPLPSVAAKPVLNDEMAAPDEDPDPEAIGDAHASLRGE